MTNPSGRYGVFSIIPLTKAQRHKEKGRMKNEKKKNRINELHELHEGARMKRDGH
jgi:hypothetical protein